MGKTQTHLSKKELKEFKELLLEERKKILEQLSEEEQLFLNQEEPDEADQADVYINNTLLRNLSDVELEKLRLIDRALEKIELGTYGICEGTGKPIPKERLRAIPWTPYTVEYAEMLDKKKKRR
ncbi:MAG: TraR/DksA family transcriptional regulator [Leptospiraceae bacterium]|nr:TraR/DksA family transcriptional regulator [Leptospiraceae bacterium]MDW7975662.1 TraR/DksA family transcriptional regulator [Leptospiraceae bacterium]